MSIPCQREWPFSRLPLNLAAPMALPRSRPGRVAVDSSVGFGEGRGSLGWALEPTRAALCLNRMRGLAVEAAAVGGSGTRRSTHSTQAQPGSLRIQARWFVPFPLNFFELFLQWPAARYAARSRCHHGMSRRPSPTPNASPGTSRACQAAPPVRTARQPASERLTIYNSTHRRRRRWQPAHSPVSLAPGTVQCAVALTRHAPFTLPCSVTC